MPIRAPGFIERPVTGQSCCFVKKLLMLMWLFQQTNSQGEVSLLLQFRHFFKEDPLELKTFWRDCVCVCVGGGGGELFCSCGEFILHTLCCFMWGVSLSCPMLFYLRSSSYLMLFYVGSFSHAFDAIFHVGSFFYIPHALLCEEFLSCFWCYFM